MSPEDKEEVSYRGVTVRDNKYPESYDEYIETIYRLSLRNPGGWVKNKDISERLQVKAPSVSNMLEKLSKAKMIDWAPRKGIRLTDKGRDRAKQIVSYHIIMELFLKRILHMKNEKEINRLACDFEHHFTPDLKKRMANLLGIENGIQNIDNVISENRFPKYIETDQLYSSTQVKQKVQSLENQLIRTISNAQDIKKLNKLIKKEFNQFYQDLEKS